MTLNLKLSITAAFCILVVGFLGSFKSYEIYQSHYQKKEVEKNQEVSEWVAQSIEQKLKQVESSVSYLDKSTVETLKRFGTRYFAYAYKNDGEWIIKWKVIGDTQKEEILSEVNKVTLDKMTQDQRSWIHNKKDHLIYVSPVELAESHQLKSGLLIFGLSNSFFGFLKGDMAQITLVEKMGHAVFNSLPKEIRASESLFDVKVAQGYQRFTQDGQDLQYVSYFSPMAQLWIVREQPAVAMSYISSPFFSYYLLGSLLTLLLFAVLASRLMTSEVKDGEAAQTEKKHKPVAKEPGFLSKIMARQGRVVAETTPVRMNNPQQVVVEDLAVLLESVIEKHRPWLAKAGIAIKTLVEEGARVRCTPQHIKDLLQRLIENSKEVLASSEDKEIQIQLVEQKKAWQLVYVDGRQEQFPSGEEPSLFLQTEGSILGIDGIVSYASWLFGESLTVAKKGFCLSIDIAKADVTSSVAQPVEAIIEEEDDGAVDDRIEISERDTDDNLLQGFIPREQSTDIESYQSKNFQDDKIEDDVPQASFDDVIESFRMKQFNFSGTKDNKQETSLPEQVDGADDKTEDGLVADEKGLFEFKSGQFKIKIRSPKTRGKDVDC